MHTTYRIPLLAQLRDQQVRFAPQDKKVQQTARAEALLAELESDKTYTYEYICFRVTDFRPESFSSAKISGADALLISFAEHNGSYTAAFKNLFDWTSRIDMRVYQDKPTVFLSTSPGPRGGANVLNTAVSAAPHQGADLKASLSVPSIYDNFDFEAGQLSNPDLSNALKEALTSLT
jgi:hypothetical protein